MIRRGRRPRLCQHQCRWRPDVEPGRVLRWLRAPHAFRTLSDVELHIVSGGVDVKVTATDKDGGIDPPKATAGHPALSAFGAGPVPGPSPRITVTTRK